MTFTPLNLGSAINPALPPATAAELAGLLSCGPLDLDLLNKLLIAIAGRVDAIDAADNAITGASYDPATNALTFTLADGPSVAIDMSGVMADFIASADASYVTPAELAAALAAANTVPSGLISLWSGAVAAVPAGWALCDGSNGTPDLRDRFVVGAGSGYTVGASGGAAGHDHGGSTGGHALTEAELAAHDHAMFVDGSVGDIGTVGADQTVAVQTNSSPGESEYVMRPLSGTPSVGITGQTGGGQAHSHTIASASSLPPYYALAYIMKL